VFSPLEEPATLRLAVIGGVKTHINNFELNLNSFLNMVYDVKYVSTGNTTEPQALFFVNKV